MKYIVIHITKGNNTLDNPSIWYNLDKCKSYLNMWPQRDISIIDQKWSVFQDSFTHSLPENAIKAIKQVNVAYIWQTLY